MGLDAQAIEIATIMRDAGFPIAGWVEEIYEGAQICKPPMFTHDIDKPMLMGTVIKLAPCIDCGDGHFIVHAIVETADGLQVPFHYGKGHTVYFADPNPSGAS